MGVVISYAETDADVAEIHRLMMVIGLPLAFLPLDAKKCMSEVYRVTHHEVAIVARAGNGEMIGGLGLIKVTMTPWWSAHTYSYFTNRWFGVLPQWRKTSACAALLAEATAIAAANDTKFILHREPRLRHERIAAADAIPAERLNLGANATALRQE